LQGWKNDGFRGKSVAGGEVPVPLGLRTRFLILPANQSAFVPSAISAVFSPAWL
jgi:hypothetical protein